MEEEMVMEEEEAKIMVEVEVMEEEEVEENIKMKIHTVNINQLKLNQHPKKLKNHLNLKKVMLVIKIILLLFLHQLMIEKFCLKIYFINF